jgi:hypothetical protein
MPQKRPCQPDVQRHTFGPTHPFAHPPLHTVFRAWTCLFDIVYADADYRWHGQTTSPTVLTATHEGVQPGATREILEVRYKREEQSKRMHDCDAHFTTHFRSNKEQHCSVYCDTIPGASGGEMAATLPAATPSVSMHGNGCLRLPIRSNMACAQRARQPRQSPRAARPCAPGIWSPAAHGTTGHRDY